MWRVTSLPSMLTSKPSPLSRPSGTTTAAVPQAKTSVTAPEAMSESRPSRLIVSSTTSRPASARSVMMAPRVEPSRIVPVRRGVRTAPSAPTTMMFMPPSSSRLAWVTSSRKQTWSHPCAAASCWGRSEEA